MYTTQAHISKLQILFSLAYILTLQKDCQTENSLCFAFQPYIMLIRFISVGRDHSSFIFTAAYYFIM